MSLYIKHIIRFLLIVLAQSLIFGQMEFIYGVHIMIYPLFIMLLPFEISTILLLIVSFFLGISVDLFMNTFGLHASSAVLIAFLRPTIYKLFAPREGYDLLKEPTIQAYGFKWFFATHFIVITVHHLYFFTMEYFSFININHILLKTLLSSIFTFLIFVAIQFIFFKKKYNM